MKVADEKVPNFLECPKLGVGAELCKENLGDIRVHLQGKAKDDLNQENKENRETNHEFNEILTDLVASALAVGKMTQEVEADRDRERKVETSQRLEAKRNTLKEQVNDLVNIIEHKTAWKAG